MDGPLIDEEQFPRSDIDIRVVRQARHRVVCKLPVMSGETCCV